MGNAPANAHVLLVDDDLGIRTTQALSLGAKGYRVTELNDGQEAVEWLKNQRPDVIITGIKMPNLGGFELLEHVKGTPALEAIPVFIFSHRGDPKDRERASAMGAAGFLWQGFTTPNELAALIEQALGKQA